MAIMTRGDQRGAAIAIGAFQIRPGGQRGSHDFRVPARTRQQKRAVADVILRVDIGATRDQQPRGFGVAALCGGEHGVAAARIARIYRRACLQQLLDFGNVRSEEHTSELQSH